jgi:secondary thiamine-phosphate synthase enzyme
MPAAAQVHCQSLEAALDTGPDLADITDGLQGVVDTSGIAQGTLTASVVGSTGSLTTIEYEPGVVQDLKDAIERLAPPHLGYAHERAWHDGNGHSHVQAALLGPSVALPVRGGRLALGTWQQVVLVNHDNKARRRTVEVTVVGAV